MHMHVHALTHYNNLSCFSIGLTGLVSDFNGLERFSLDICRTRIWPHWPRPF